MSRLKIAFWSAGNGMWGEITPGILEEDRQLGGAETALIHIARGLAKTHNVTVYHGDCPLEKIYDGARWQPAKTFNPRDCYDALILWDNSDICQYDPCAHAVILAARCNTQPHLRRHYRIDWLVALSDWHCGVLCQQYEILSTEKASVIGNGVDLKRYREGIEPIPNRIIYCSSPDRGLHHLLRIWPKIRERIPAELHCYYSFGGFERVKWQMNQYAATWWYVKTHLDQPGVFNHGAVGQSVLAREQKKASLMVYPSDLFVDGETFASSILECMAAGVPCLISDAAALPGVYGDAAAIMPRPIVDEQWVGAIVQLLTDETLRLKYIERGRKFARRHTWKKVVYAWERLIAERVQAARAGEGGFIKSRGTPMGNSPALWRA